MPRLVIAVVMTVAVCPIGVAAAQQDQRASADTPAAPLTDGIGAFTASVNAVIGTARSVTNDPLPHAPLRLRSLLTGRIEASTVAEADGRFVFRSIEPGTYVVELLDENGVVLSTSEAVTVASNEIIQTLVRLPGRVRSFAWWTGSTAATAMSAASGIGVLAVDETAAPASPER